MLLRRDATYIDPLTKQVERVFPMGEDWLDFQSRLPTSEVFNDTVLDPAIGLADGLSLLTFANADWSNWVRSIRVATFELGTRVGLPAIDNVTNQVAAMFTQLSTSLANVDSMPTNELIEDVLRQTGAAAINALAMSGNPVAMAVAAVAAAAIWIVDVVASYKNSELAKNVTLPPLQTADPATDSWQVNRVFELLRLPPPSDRGAVLPDGAIIRAGNADLTPLFMPAYKQTDPWTFAWRDQGIAAQQGQASKARGPGGEIEYPFNAVDGGFGFMPGTNRMLRTLQASYRYYQILRADVGVDRYNLRCNAVDKPCGQTVKGFDGTVDCKQCVTPESVWPQQGLGWAYAGLPFNATTPGENTGEFHVATNKLIATLQKLIIGEGDAPNPLTFCVDAEQMQNAWQDCFERFWEWMPGAWQQYRGKGWRGLLARLASFMVAYRAELPGGEGDFVLGGRLVSLPASVVVNPRDKHSWSLPFDVSIYKLVIEPFCQRLGKYQLAQIEDNAPYVPPLAAAAFHASGKFRNNQIGRALETRRKDLLQSPERMNVDLRLVTDAEYRQALIDSGVKASPVKAGLLGAGKVAPPTRAKRHVQPPRVNDALPPLAGVVDLVGRAGVRPTVGAEGEQDGEGGMAVALALGSAVVAIGGGALAWRVLGRKGGRRSSRRW